MRKMRLIDLPIDWKRGNGLTKSDIVIDGNYKCVLYGELFTKHKQVLIDSFKLSRTNQIGSVKSKYGDILVPGTSTAAKRDMILARELDEEGVFLGGDINIIRPQKNLFAKKFVAYYFETIDAYEQLEGYINGATGIIHISNTGLKNLKIPLPPLSEQEEIVSILDDVFESIERAKLNAEQNLKNAKELFDSYLQNIFEKGKWANTTLEKLSNKKDSIVSGPFGSNLKVSDYKEKGVPILRLQNVGKGKFINKSIKFITKEKAEELKYHSFKSGDIVLAKLGIPIGKTCIIPDSFDDGIITADVVRIRPDKNSVNYKFLEYFLNTNISVSQLTGNISGATRPRVNLSDVRNIKLVLPKLDEQLVIVNELDNLTIKINKLEEILVQKINCLKELKKSILQKAFNGELKTSKISV